MSNIVSFYNELPSAITINRNWSCRPSEPENAWKQPYLQEPVTVESVRDALVRGPFVARAGVGPSYYSVEPFEFKGRILAHPEVSVYGWRADAERISDHLHVPIIICGVQRTGSLEHIYYVLANDISPDPTKAIGTIEPLSTDQKVYVVSVKTFAQFEFDMFPPVSEEEIAQFIDEPLVPTPLAGRPDLIDLWKRGKIIVTELEGQVVVLMHQKP